MKYAIALRGISYLKEHKRPNMETYEINFEWAYPFFKKNIVEPLKEQGHEIDIFFNTYNSEKLEKFNNFCNPVDSLITNYNPNIGAGNWNNINKINYDTINLIKKYQVRNNIKYDMIILSRFDLLPFAKITDFFIPDNTLSIIEPRLDTFLIFSENIFETMLNLFKKKFMIHEFVKILDKKFKIKTHLMFTIKFSPDSDKIPRYIHPLSTNTRNCFINEDHYYRTKDPLAIKNFDNMNNPESWYPLLKNFYEKYWEPNEHITINRD